MPRGIMVFGANGSGKSTLGPAVARALRFKYMDIEEYRFVKSDIPYTARRSREDCIKFMRTDIKRHGSFVISAVIGDFGEEISSMFQLAAWISAPLETRLERIRRRSWEQYGARVQAGGDLYEQNLRFLNFVASRSLSGIERWAETLSCPVIQVDGTKSVAENTERIIRQFLKIGNQREDGPHD